jgi:C4-dicarboxylate transporter, DctM subunit
MNEVIIGITALFVLLMFFLTGIELGFAMAIVGFIGFGILKGFSAACNIVAIDIFDVFTTYGFTVVPVFVLMGQIAFNAGIARKLYDSAYKFIGHVPGGLAMATVAGATTFKAICGSSPATAATFASVAVPEMDRYGYAKKLSTGIVASVGTLGILIPPSVTLIIFGMITEQSIAKLFMAGMIPGLLVAFFFVVVIYGWCKIDPSAGPKGEKSSWSARFKSLPEVLLVVVIFITLVVGLMDGFFTPTEAGSIGTMAVLILAVIKKDINFKGYIKSLLESLRTACMVLMLIAGSAILGHFLAVTKIPILAADWIGGLPLNRYVIMILISLIYQLGGSFIDDLAFMILATPIFFPVAIKLGFDPIWFSILIALTVMIGCVIPPVASNVFIVRNITKVPLGVIYSGVYPFLMSLAAVTALLFVFPGMATYLPSLLVK